MLWFAFTFCLEASAVSQKKTMYIPHLYSADQDYNFASCVSAEVTSRIKYLSVTVKAASYTALTRALRGMPLAVGTNERLGSELTAAGARRSATSVASPSRKDAQNAAASLT